MARVFVCLGYHIEAGTKRLDRLLHIYNNSPNLDYCRVLNSFRIDSLFQLCLTPIELDEKFRLLYIV